jgi:hypothetical protein
MSAADQRAKKQRRLASTKRRAVYEYAGSLQIDEGRLDGLSDCRFSDRARGAAVRPRIRSAQNAGAIPASPRPL